MNADPSPDDPASFDPNGPPPGRIELLVNTWHVAPLHGGQPEGLPTDLLTTHSALFYLVDRVVVDASGLAGERKWKAYGWLSARVFSWLEDADLLRIVNLNAPPFVPATFWFDLAQHPKGRDVQREMQRRTHQILKGDLEARREALHKIDASILSLNQNIFLNLNVPDNWLPYYQTEAHLKADPWQDVQPADIPNALPISRRERQRRRVQALNTVEGHLPDPMLLPPVTRQTKGLLTRNMNREKVSLYRVIYGDLSHGNFQDFRTSEKFKKIDEKVDNEVRERIAWENFQMLLRIRSQTKDLRASLQDLILQIADTELPMAEAYNEIERQLRAFRALMMSEMPIEKRMEQIMVESVAIALMEQFLLRSFSDYPQIIPGVAAPILPVLYLLLKYKRLEPRKRQQLLAEARQTAPLAAFYRELAELLPEGRKLFDPDGRLLRYAD